MGGVEGGASEGQILGSRCFQGWVGPDRSVGCMGDWVDVLLLIRGK